MSYGLQVWNGSGQLRLDVQDMTTRLHSSGSVYIAQNATATIAVSGMVNDGSWFVVTLGDAVASIGNGQFTLTNYNGSSVDFTVPFVFKYSVFRA